VTVVPRLLADLKEILERASPDPADGSPSAEERKAYRRPQSIRTLDTHAHELLLSGADNLAAFDLLVEAGDLAIAPWVVARAALEALASLVWLLDRNVSVDTRVGRSLALRFEGLEAQEVLAVEDGNQKVIKSVQDRIQVLETTAIGLGFPKMRNKKGKRNGVAVRKPSKTELVGNLLGKANTYRIVSGMAHSETNTLRQLAFATVGPSGFQGVVMMLTPATMVLKPLLANVAAAYARGAWEVILRDGADAAEAAVVLDRHFDDLNLKDDNRTRFWRVLVR
jgi:hypothetical protein